MYGIYTKVACLDVTPGGLATSCDTDGHLLVWTTENGEVRVCHLNDLTEISINMHEHISVYLSTSCLISL